MTSQTLRSLVQLPDTPAPLSQSTLIMIDCQNTYRQGVMRLEGVEEALDHCTALLRRARNAGAAVIHIMHDAGPGSPYDVNAPIGQISDEVAPVEGEPVIVKPLPSAFEQTSLNDTLKLLERDDLVLAGFMTHMCVNSTARGAFNRGYRPTVVANATATRSLRDPGSGSDVEAAQVKSGALAGLSDLFAIVVAEHTSIADA